MKFWDGTQYRPISPDEAKHRIAEGQVPVVQADVPEGDECPMCTGEILHVHVQPTSDAPPEPEPLPELEQDAAPEVVVELEPETEAKD